MVWIIKICHLKRAILLLDDCHGLFYSVYPQSVQKLFKGVIVISSVIVIELNYSIFK